MNLSNDLFNKLIKSLPGIEVELEYDDCRGFFSSENHEIEAGQFVLNIDFMVHDSGSICKGDNMTPSTFVSSKSAFVSSVKVFDYDSEQVATLSNNQQVSLSKEIELIIEKS